MGVWQGLSPSAPGAVMIFQAQALPQTRQTHFQPNPTLVNFLMATGERWVLKNSKATLQRPHHPPLGGGE